MALQLTPARLNGTPDEDLPGEAADTGAQTSAAQT